MSATGAQRSIARNVANVDVAAAGEGSQVTHNIENLNVSTFGLKLGGERPRRSVVQARAADAPHLDVSALRVQAGGAADVPGCDVARFGNHLDVESARHGNFKLNPELGVGRYARFAAEACR